MQCNVGSDNFANLILSTTSQDAEQAIQQMAKTGVNHDPSRFFKETNSSDEGLSVKSGSDKSRTVLIVLHQPVTARRAFFSCYDTCEWRIYADGGANRVAQLCERDAGRVSRSLAPDLIIGDLDSLNKDTERQFQGEGALIVKDPDQYSTDFGKAVKAISCLQSYASRETFSETFKRGLQSEAGSHRLPIRSFFEGKYKSCPQPIDEKLSDSLTQRTPTTTDVIVFSGLGGRLDQGIGLLSETANYQKDTARWTNMFMDSPLRFWLVSERSLSWILDGPPMNDSENQLQSVHHVLQLSSPIDVRNRSALFTQNVGILPVYGSAVITTKGLEWDVTDWKTDMGGQVSTSNHVVSDDGVVEITTNFTVLFTVELSERMLDS